MKIYCLELPAFWAINAVYIPLEWIMKRSYLLIGENASQTGSRKHSIFNQNQAALCDQALDTHYRFLLFIFLSLR
ncbi:hypothetical protein MYX82_03140 [Acidobacteria bacterium AH-259-D05]|nr:hypothetical protein [Acidobacteria bacterium AH-259-D05]